LFRHDPKASIGVDVQAVLLPPELIALHTDVDRFEVTSARQHVAQNGAFVRQIRSMVSSPRLMLMRTW
jgi:hypothetical protein